MNAQQIRNAARSGQQQMSQQPQEQMPAAAPTYQQGGSYQQPTAQGYEQPYAPDGMTADQTTYNPGNPR